MERYATLSSHIEPHAYTPNHIGDLLIDLGTAVTAPLAIRFQICDSSDFVACTGISDGQLTGIVIVVTRTSGECQAYIFDWWNSRRGQRLVHVSPLDSFLEEFAVCAYISLQDPV
jgi:hypothetical protein